MALCVVDTNVIAAANNQSSASAACAAAAAEALQLIVAEGRVAEDTTDLIYDEYRRHADHSGQPGAGDYFFRWFANHRFGTARVVRVPIDLDEHGVPVVPDRLSRFDQDDKKFVAVYLHAEADALLNATDSDWDEHALALAASGINVSQVCSTAPR